MSKVWLITGSGRGLGRDITAAALEADDSVLATARDPHQLDDLVARYDDRIAPFVLDVGDAARAQAAVDAAVARFGRLDVLVNNAGYADLAAVEDVTLDAFRAQVETNLFGVVNLSKAAVPLLREQGGGQIIQISSVGGRMASAGLSAYQAAKWAVGGFSEVLAREVAPLGIKVTVLEPGGMSTDWSGASMAIPPVSAPYEQTVGVRARQYADGVATTSDPAKVAQLVLQLTRMDDPPLRLLAGSDAVRGAAAAASARAESDARHRDLSVSTDHEAV
ncbi:SDR family NAD(P)-dependent oxidoreductase [Conexibacter sp. CPCC 206217]|uniref:SDR family NAD(P)-dependent oxidoreductase n=1 Tax=Conexibacter sp. CPCC 206217 TaxID=3064574 RepID=UPI00271CC43E|nr:SDR family NAD(P)-dependent oxidoreductase [Conexibacter sp. CPCC 206217]MDO8210297.1 SDR family NAD(P)-dependent oxidoreductase [Conexibacter sp. CPCC 206217]